MANGLPYYKAYPRDFIEGTIGLPFEIKCAYRVVIDLIYMQGGKLPDDARYISGLLGCSLRKWSALRDALILAGKLQASGGFISNYRADKEIETLAKLQDIQRQNASGPRKNKDLQKPPLRQPEPEPYKKERVSNETLAHFDNFWDVWPIKTAKAAAAKAWAKLPQHSRRAAIDGAQSFFERWRRAYPTANPIHPASYLNGKRWEDEFNLKAIDGGRNGQSATKSEQRMDAFIRGAAVT